MVVSGINNFQSVNNSLKFGARTRSERERDEHKAYTRMVTVTMSEDDLNDIEIARQEYIQRRQELRKKKEEESRSLSAEKQYREDTKDLKDTQNIIREITQSDKDKNIFAGSWLQKAGKVADIVITGTLSGMALHWSTGKAFMMMNKVVKKPKISKAINNAKRPFEILGSAIKKGSETAWATLSKEVKASEKGKKFLETPFMKKVNKGADEVQKTWSDFKKDVNALKAEDYKAGISTVFGVSGFVAGVVEKLDTPNKQNQKDV